MYISELATNSNVLILSYLEVRYWYQIRRSRNRKTDAIILTYGKGLIPTGVYKIKFKRGVNY